MSRYIILDKSDSGHCCFTHSIIDTKDGLEEYSTQDNLCWKNCIAETFCEEDAELIVNALNKLEE